MYSQNFYLVLDKIGGQSEIDSVYTLMRNAQNLNPTEFHILLGKAIRQPELLRTRFELAIRNDK